MTEVEVNHEQYLAIYEALQMFVRFEEPAALDEDRRAFVVRDRAGHSEATVRFVLAG